MKDLKIRCENEYRFFQALAKCGRCVATQADEFYNINYKKLQHFFRYPMPQSAVNLLESRIACIKGEKDKWEREMDNLIEANKMIEILEQARKNGYTLNESDLNALIDILKRYVSFKI